MRGDLPGSAAAGKCIMCWRRGPGMPACRGACRGVFRGGAARRGIKGRLRGSAAAAARGAASPRLRGRATTPWRAGGRAGREWAGGEGGHRRQGAAGAESGLWCKQLARCSARTQAPGRSAQRSAGLATPCAARAPRDPRAARLLPRALRARALAKGAARRPVGGRLKCGACVVLPAAEAGGMGRPW